MFGFKQKIDLSLDENNFCFKHNYFDNFQEFSNSLQPFNGEILHLSSGKFKGYVSQVCSNQMQLLLQQHSSLFLYKGACLNHFGFSISAFHYGSLYSHQYQIDIDSITIVYPNKEVASFQQKNHSNYIIIFPNELLNNICETFELFELKRKLDNRSIPPVVKANNQKVGYIRQLCHQIYQVLFQNFSQRYSSKRNLLVNKFVREKLEEDIAKIILIAIAEARQIKLSKPQIKRSHILKKAEELFLNNLKLSITIQDICQELEVSKRTLEYIFKDYYEMSPKKYFKYLRLNALHQELQQKDKKVNLREITEEFGFYHRGQFARDYHKLFGKFPSEILRE
ncbi:MAG: helix-turn-helix domain-containing protein [Crocosphaera sp.]|nr:helix-turn-helix domain-containing protein [Crocosphaera sp.]